MRKLPCETVRSIRRADARLAVCRRASTGAVRMHLKNSVIKHPVKLPNESQRGSNWQLARCGINERHDGRTIVYSSHIYPACCEAIFSSQFRFFHFRSIGHVLMLRTVSQAAGTGVGTEREPADDNVTLKSRITLIDRTLVKETRLGGRTEEHTTLDLSNENRSQNACTPR